MAEFKPSFIPKKPIIAKREEGRTRAAVGFLSFFSLIIFFSSLTLAGALFLYEAFLERNITTIARSVERAKEIIEPDLIVELTRLDSRVNVSRALLDDRIVIAPVFGLLETLTLPTMRFEQFRYVLDEDGRAQLTLSGEAKNYTSLALQSNIFGENVHIQEPLFSNLRLNARGNVRFDFSAFVDQKFILYRNNLGNSPAIPEIQQEIPGLEVGVE